MLNILLVSTRPDILHAFLEGLSSDREACLEQVMSGAEALNIVRTGCPQLVIVDSETPDTDPLDLVRAMISINAKVNTALISPLPEAEFHEKSEGLGVLCRLPLMPGATDSAALLQKLRGLSGLVNQA